MPELIQKSVEKKLSKYCDEKIPAHVKDKIRLEYEFEGKNIILSERRPHFQDPKIWTKCPIAKFSYVKSASEWKLYCSDRNGRWHHYKKFIIKNFDDLVNEIDNDPTGIFWG